MAPSGTIEGEEEQELSAFQVCREGLFAVLYDISDGGYPVGFAVMVVLWFYQLYQVRRPGPAPATPSAVRSFRATHARKAATHYSTRPLGYQSSCGSCCDAPRAASVRLLPAGG
jgi:hypothetical protein